MTHNVVIIGAGVAGLSVALALLRRGQQVTVLERGNVGGESSWAGAGILSPLLPWDYPAAVSAIALRSMAAYPAWVGDIEALSGKTAEYWRCGMQVRDCALPEEARVWCTQHDFACSTVTPPMDEVPSYIAPTLGTKFAPPPYPADTLHLPDIAQVRNPRLIAALLKAVIVLGGRVIEQAQVLALTGSDSGGRVTAVVTPSATFAADQVVIASGAWAGTDPQLGVPNIRPVRGQMLLYKLKPGLLNTILYCHCTYLIPRRDGHILVGSTLEYVGFDKSTTTEALNHLQEAASAIWPNLSGHEVKQHWSGLRPGSPGNIPIIDRHPDFDNVFINTGHYRYGVTMAPASAELLVDLMEGKTPALDPVPYSWQAALARRWDGHL